jgi:hypothetical protein
MARAAALNIALSGVPQAFAAAGRASHGASFERVVADSRLEPSLAFATTMARHGVRVSATDGDLTALWFDDLARHFASGNGPIAGLTTSRTALVMTELARGPGVRVLWRADHMAMPDGGMRHEVQGAASLVAQAGDLGRQPDWIAGLAAAVAGHATASGARGPTKTAVVHSSAAGESLEETLSSWVLIPRRAG